MNFKRLSPFGVRDNYESLPVIEPLRQPKSTGCRLTMLLNGSVEVSERDKFPANCQRDQMALRMRLKIFKILRRVDKLAISLYARAVKIDLDLVRLVRGKVEEEQVPSGVVDDAPAVSGNGAGVKVLMIRVAAKVFAGDLARIEISNA